MTEHCITFASVNDEDEIVDEVYHCHVDAITPEDAVAAALRTATAQNVSFVGANAVRIVIMLDITTTVVDELERLRKAQHGNSVPMCSPSPHMH